MSERMPSFEDVSKEPQKFMSEGEIKESNLREKISNLENEKFPDFKKVFVEILDSVYNSVDKQDVNGELVRSFHIGTISPEESHAKVEKVMSLIEDNGYQVDRKLESVTDKQGFVWSLCVTQTNSENIWSCTCIKHDGSGKGKDLVLGDYDESMPNHYIRFASEIRNME